MAASADSLELLVHFPPASRYDVCVMNNKTLKAYDDVDIFYDFRKQSIIDNMPLSEYRIIRFYWRFWKHKHDTEIIDWIESCTYVPAIIAFIGITVSFISYTVNYHTVSAWSTCITGALIVPMVIAGILIKRVEKRMSKLRRMLWRLSPFNHR